MASQSPEPAQSDQKLVTSPSMVEKDERNGTADVNGHAPAADSVSELKSPQDAKAVEQSEQNGVNHKDGQNESVPTKTAEKEVVKQVPSEPETLKPAAPEAPKPTDKNELSDIEMDDAQADTSAAEKAPEAAPAKANGSPSVASPPPVLPEGEPTTKESSQPDPKPDVDMSDAPATSGDVPSVDQAASTQETATSDIPAATPAEDVSLHPASMSSLAIDATQASPEPIATADTSMSDAPQSSAKVARGREEDADDGPAAKRVKTDPPSDAAEATRAPAESMDVDREVLQQTSMYQSDGKPKALDDSSLDGNIMSRYQSQKIRGVLAGIKKTKAGGNFKAPVQLLWPQLWEDYQSKVSEPTDITTMEKRLRGGDSQYPPYLSLGDFKRDLRRLHENAVKFNGADHFVAAQGKQVVEQVMERLSFIPAVENAVDEKKAPKQHPSRHTDHRPAPANPPAAQAPRRPSKPAAPAPVEKPVQQSPAFAIPPNNNGVPLIRRESTKNGDDRPKRPIHPPKTKDFGYNLKKKKKLSPELRFCNEVLTEITKAKYFEIHGWFLQPVDTVALNIPTYYKMIKKPMDLETMQSKLNTGQYTNAKEFERDFWQIGKNCRTFNGEDSLVTSRVIQLEDLFRSEWAKKDAWMAKNAPPERLTQHERPSPRHKADSDEDDADSEEEVEEKEQSSEAKLLESLTLRLSQEQEKLNEQMAAKVPDLAQVEVAQMVIATLQRQIIQARQKLAEAVPAKKPAKSKAAQPKKPSGALKKKIGSGLDASRNSATTNKKAGGGVKKAPKRFMGQIEKSVIGQAITALEGIHLERAIEIIKRDSDQMENDSGELEIDIESLSQEALVKLYDLSIKAFPSLRADVERDQVVPPPEEPTPKPKSSKPKKNKPMGKAEQEARLRHLSDLKAQIKGRNSGSQEPIESIEENGGSSVAGANDHAPAPYQDSEEEESSEEE